MYSSIRQLYCCDITDIKRVPPERATYTKLMKPLKKSYLLIGLSKFAQTFAVRFLKSSSIHLICINAWGSFSFKLKSWTVFSWLGVSSLNLWCQWMCIADNWHMHTNTHICIHTFHTCQQIQAHTHTHTINGKYAWNRYLLRNYICTKKA